ncbi:hypothetical protein ABH15_10835 [Methanoculleus taiwanensis]|uniref:Methanogenesis regulatory protein FilR1 middle domain-containing protein n=1 Tax=Methanoculleus taiwanensis TaxID=1550565 RepID=A0A498GWK2_9EURY|nr:transcriptional regulator FilR1 domain-containing protein [Methanoculleus taiwanensis]RXE55271.1 hypothetical protein ABH15_10835 [Methanoculleus taiwanensis]
MKIIDFMKIFASERRIEVLDALVRGESKEEIKEHIPPSTFAFTFNHLKQAGFADVRGGDVCLTDRGHAYLVIFETFKDNVNALEKLFNAFPDHTIAFPDEFFMRLHEIGDFELITSEPSNVLKPHQVFFENIRKSKSIRGISPLMFPDYVDFFGQMINSIDTISLVVTEEIYGRIPSSARESETINFYIIDEVPPIAAAVTDRFVSLGFFYKSGSYDFTRDAISTSPRAIAFGNALIEHYMKQSRKI